MKHAPTSRRLAKLAAAGALLLSAGCASDEPADRAETPSQPAGLTENAAPNTLTEAERAAGWQLLFDGQSFAGWRGLRTDTIPTQHWQIVDGQIKKIASGNVPVQADGQPSQGGDLITEQPYENFELSFEWKVTPGANSGIKYNVSREMSRGNAIGFEYQVLDDDRHPDARAGVNGNRTSGGLYDLIAPQNKQVRPVGEYNQGRIVFNGNHGEHWLNGQKVLEYDLGTPRMDSLVAASKYKPIEGFADKRAGHIVLQDHNDEVWYRNIKIRPL